MDQERTAQLSKPGSWDLHLGDHLRYRGSVLFQDELERMFTLGLRLGFVIHIMLHSCGGGTVPHQFFGHLMVLVSSV